jgi:hypothetical protein
MKDVSSGATVDKKLAANTSRAEESISRARTTWASIQLTRREIHEDVRSTAII